VIILRPCTSMNILHRGLLILLAVVSLNLGCGSDDDCSCLGCFWKEWLVQQRDVTRSSGYCHIEWIGGYRGDTSRVFEFVKDKGARCYLSDFYGHDFESVKAYANIDSPCEQSDLDLSKWAYLYCGWDYAEMQCWAP
jgi:hypothetical protein